MELQRTIDRIHAQGLGLAAISYDSVATLKKFADAHAITFPLLSDEGSKTITAWGILNATATGRTAGIPYPGTYVIDRRGRIESRSFEEAYTERDTAASILARLGAPSSPPPAGAVDAIGKYVRLRASSTDAIAAPGHKFTLVVDVTPGKNVHVYAPGQTGYIPAALTIDPSADYKLAPVAYPAPRPYVFGPAKETVRVFDRPFRLTEDVTLALTPSMRQRATAKTSLTIAGVFEYQACDDKVCFNVDRVPLSWTITLTPIER